MGPSSFAFSHLRIAQGCPEAPGNLRAKSPRWAAISQLFCISMLVMLANTACLPAQPSESRSLKLPHPAAGTVVVDADAERWNRVVLMARYRVASGDVNVLSSSIRKAVSEFTETVMATVKPYSHPESGEPRYRLEEVGIGYSSDQGGHLMVLTRDTAEQLGFKLNFIQRQILFVSEKLIDNVRLIARTSTLTIFDTPTVMLRDGEHRAFIIRHFVWVDSRSGAAASMTWLLEEHPTGTSVVATEPIRQLPPAYKEDRKYHVDKNEFTFGIPSKRAFALESLPPGRPLAWAPDAMRLAALPSYSMDELRELTIALNAAIADSQTPKTALLPLHLVEQPEVQK